MNFNWWGCAGVATAFAIAPPLAVDPLVILAIMLIVAFHPAAHALGRHAVSAIDIVCDLLLAWLRYLTSTRYPPDDM